MVLVGALAAVGVALRFVDGLGQGPDAALLGRGQPAALALVAAYVATLVVLLATDLDQRLLPDVLTLPWIVVGLAALVGGLGPYVLGAPVVAVVVALAVPLALWVLSIPFGRGAIGIGDLKLLVSVGLIAGAERTVAGLLAGVLFGGLCIGVLLLARRITLRSYVPYGPFLIVGALWALLLPG